MLPEAGYAAAREGLVIDISQLSVPEFCSLLGSGLLWQGANGQGRSLQLKPDLLDGFGAEEMMQPRENELVLILADISGYTRFMVENQLSAIHGQICISTLIETLLREVDIPLTLQEIEGDAVFLYAAHPGDSDEWQEVLRQVRTKLARFFTVFHEGMVAASESTPCQCAICSHAEELSLKIVVHSGTAVFHTIAGRPQVSGADVILAHRLLKNSVASSQYLLMSESAYQDLGAQMDMNFEAHVERYDEFGDVEVRLHDMDETVEEARDSLYSLDEKSLTARARGYVYWAVLSQVSAAFAQVRSPSTNVGWIRRVAFAVILILLVPLQFAVLIFTIPRKLLAQRLVRSRDSASV